MKSAGEKGIEDYPNLRRYYEGELLPLCLSIGVDYDAFWELTPRRLAIHEKAYELRLREIDRRHHAQGAYIYKALDVVVYNALRRNEKPIEYPARPLMEPEETDDEKLDREIRQAILNEQLWIADAKRKGLPETVINLK